jgi:hypothetical protein
MEKSDLTLSTFTQYVEDFKFWMSVAGRPHRLPEKEIAKMFVGGLKPEIFKEEIGSRACENLQGAITEARRELSTYRELLEISERMKKTEIKRVPKYTGPSEAVKLWFNSYDPNTVL